MSRALNSLNISFFYDSLAPSYDCEIVEGSPFFSHLYRTLDKIVDKVFSDGRYNRIVDIGCGTGHFSIKLASAGREVFGLDLSKESVKVARRKAAGSRISNAHFTVADAQELPFKPNAFDAGLAMGSLLNHASEPEAIVREAFRVLRGGHILLMDVDNFPSLDLLGYMLNPCDGCYKVSRKELIKCLLTGAKRGFSYFWIHGRKALKLRVFTFRELEALLAQRGFKIGEVYGVHVLLPALSLNENLNNNRGKLGSLLKSVGRIDEALGNKGPLKFLGASLVILCRKSLRP